MTGRSQVRILPPQQAQSVGKISVSGGASLKLPSRKISNKLIFNDYLDPGRGASTPKLAISRQNAVPGADFGTTKEPEGKEKMPRTGGRMLAEMRYGLRCLQRFYKYRTAPFRSFCCLWRRPAFPSSRSFLHSAYNGFIRSAASTLQVQRWSSAWRM